MFNFLSFLMSSLHSIPFRHAIHFLACITFDFTSLSSVSLVSKITPRYLYFWQNSISLFLSIFKFKQLYKMFSHLGFSLQPTMLKTWKPLRGRHLSCYVTNKTFTFIVASKCNRFFFVVSLYWKTLEHILKFWIYWSLCVPARLTLFTMCTSTLNVGHYMHQHA
jgi:hypothetical protein